MIVTIIKSKVLAAYTPVNIHGTIKYVTSLYACARDQLAWKNIMYANLHLSDPFHKLEISSAESNIH